MSNEMVIRKALVAGLNFDDVFGEEFVFEGNMVPFNYGHVDITDALTSRGMQYLIGKLKKSVDIEAKRAGVNIEGCEEAKALFIEGLSKALCAIYSMGEQHGMATDREMAAQRARGYLPEQVEIIE